MEQQKNETQNSPKKGRKKWILVILAVLIIGLIAIRVIGARQELEADERTLVNVRVAAAKLSDIQVATPLTGKIQAENQVSVGAGLQTEITGVYVSVGDYVSKGTLLFTHDTSAYQGSYDQAQASVNQAQAGVNQAQVSLDLANEGLSTAQTNLERVQALYNEGAVSLQTLEQAETSYNTALLQVEQANAAISQATAGVNQAKAGVTSAGEAFSNSRVTAPISGYVTEVNVTQGATLLSAVAVSISDTNNLEITTDVSEYLISKVKEGSTVSIKVPSLNGEAFEGTIKTIAPAPGTAGLTYPVTISLANAPDGVMAGMFAEIYVVSEERLGVVAIPSDAVMIKSSETKVAVLDGNVPRFVTVETGIDNGELVEIKSGVSAGDIVIVEGQSYVIENQEVNIIE